MLRHPRGLAVLFFTEMWERFSFYGMKALLVLYLVTATKDGGMGWSDADALTLLAVYSSLVYLMCIPGGILADSLLGPRRAVMLGGGLLCAGHLLMAVPQEWAFFTALGLIVLGVGCLKPNISTMVGGLYAQGDVRRDSGFTLFYMGINLGAMLAPIATGLVAEVYGWHVGFSLAGVGMILGQIVYIWGQRYLTPAESPPAAPQPEEDSVLADVVAPDEPRETPHVLRDRVLLLVLALVLVNIFFACYEQAPGLLNLYAERYTDRHFGPFEIPAAMFQSLAAMFVFLFGVPVAALWVVLAKRGLLRSSLSKMGLGTVVMGLGYIFMLAAVSERESTGFSAMHWLVLTYLFHALGELALSPVSLSFITKIAPRRLKSSMMGLYFGVTGVADFMAGMLGRLAVSVGEEFVFVLVLGLSVGLGLLVMMLHRPLARLSHGADA